MTTFQKINMVTISFALLLTCITCFIQQESIKQLEYRITICEDGLTNQMALDIYGEYKKQIDNIRKHQPELTLREAVRLFLSGQIYKELNKELSNEGFEELIDVGGLECNFVPRLQQ